MINHVCENGFNSRLTHLRYEPSECGCKSTRNIQKRASVSFETRAMDLMHVRLGVGEMCVIYVRLDKRHLIQTYHLAALHNVVLGNKYDSTQNELGHLHLLCRCARIHVTVK